MNEQMRDWEAEATKDGWNPDFEGEGAKTAQEYVETGEKIAGIATKKARKLEAELDEVKASVATMKDQFIEQTKRTVERERSERAKEVASLESRLAEAINNGDGEDYIRLGKQLEEVKASPVASDGAAINAKWAEKNTWYAADPVLRRYADSVAADLDNSGFHGSQQEFMDKVAEVTKKDMAHKFENPKRKETITGEEEFTQEEAGDNNYKALDAEAKAICDRLVSEGVLTQAQYVADYFGK